MRNILMYGLEVQALVVKTAIGEDLEFERTEGEIQEGDRATIDGQPAQGEFLMASGDVYIFKKGILVELIYKKVEELARFVKNRSYKNRQKAAKEREQKAAPIGKLLYDNLEAKNGTSFYGRQLRKQNRASGCKYIRFNDEVTNLVKKHLPMHRKGQLSLFDMDDVRNTINRYRKGV